MKPERVATVREGVVSAPVEETEVVPVCPKAAVLADSAVEEALLTERLPETRRLVEVALVVVPFVETRLSMMLGEATVEDAYSAVLSQSGVVVEKVVVP